MFEVAKPQVASPPEKPCVVREVWQSQTCARSRLSLAKQRKEVTRAGMRRKGEQNGKKEGYLKFYQLLETHFTIDK